MTERDIISGLGKGDWKSYTILYKQYYEPIRYFVYKKFVHDIEIAHEVTHEAFVKLWKKRKDFDSIQSVKAFLYISTKNACLNHIKHLKVRKSAHEEILYNLEKENETTQAYQLQSDLVRAVFRESGSLTKTCKRIIDLHYREGLSYKEIAQRLEISVENVRVQHANAVNALRSLLKSKDLLFLVAMCTLLFI